ncbi:hypothetical protein E0H50_02770 [Kribbella sindirgiensis]|uniref:Uncharacterized protein n=1 Tax=Kribbella sindirgiensis TaxID=1124744 RepID=A0A4R0JC39_9ACTN|nr:hypothetical protein E0H50_02770 [Kribbella sindirgiensis]
MADQLGAVGGWSGDRGGWAADGAAARVVACVECAGGGWSGVQLLLDASGGRRADRGSGRDRACGRRGFVPGRRAGGRCGRGRLRLLGGCGRCARRTHCAS